jgi:class 3 adenylate cyclase
MESTDKKEQSDKKESFLDPLATVRSTFDYYLSSLNLRGSFGKIIGTSLPDSIYFPVSSIEKFDKLKAEINEKESQNTDLINEIKRLNEENKDITAKNKDITAKLEKLNENILYIQKKEQLLRLTSNVHPKAADILLAEGDNTLLNYFNSASESQNAILSIDIRRSTDLMLNAHDSDAFARFITDLCEGLKIIVISNFGVFDKFTGDGILAYFPIFYSGDDAVHKCCITSQQCHNFFEKYYKEKRNMFKINLKTGLGIGIDFGSAKLVRINSEHTIVGVPVVYACRLSNAPFGHTYINQSAYQNLKDKGIEINEIKLDEIDFEIKNQGTVTVYDLVKLENIKIKEPDWFCNNAEDKKTGE